LAVFLLIGEILGWPNFSDNPLND